MDDSRHKGEHGGRAGEPQRDEQQESPLASIFPPSPQTIDRHAKSGHREREEPSELPGKLRLKKTLEASINLLGEGLGIW
jgi:hypothetical protein